jgi:UDP:flavonoid glycosyltransferase YjiC (YdhE family)
MGRDQHDVAARVVYPGAGVRLRARAKPDAIRSAVERVIREPGFRAAAGRIGASITADATAQRGLTELETLASA